jgi:hypothetical protein
MAVLIELQKVGSKYEGRKKNNTKRQADKHARKKQQNKKRKIE